MERFVGIFCTSEKLRDVWEYISFFTTAEGDVSRQRSGHVWAPYVTTSMEQLSKTLAFNSVPKLV